MQELVNLQVTTRPTKWVSSLTYLHKPDGTLWISLNPDNLNKTIIREYYQALHSMKFAID